MTAAADQPDEYRCFIAECYLPQATTRRAAEVGTALCDGARVVSIDTDAVRFVSLIVLPTDDTCFGLFESGSAELVKRVLEHAAIDYERIVGAIWVRAHPEGPP